MLGLFVALTGCIAEAESDQPPQTSTHASQLATPWSLPVRIGAVSALGAYDSEPAISADGLELYFISDRDGGRRIYMSTRFSTEMPWGSPVPVYALWGSAVTYDNGPELSHDGLTIWFSRSTAGQPGPQLQVATRAIRSLGWSTPTPLAELAINASAPHVSQDGLTMYFANTDPASLDIYSTTRPSLADTWRNIRPVNRFNSSGTDTAPTTARGEREAYLDSTRGGALRVYRSTRTFETAWSTPVVVEELAGASNTDVTPDANYMVMMMSPNGGDPDIYESRR
ncbi:MAG TPA: hypothetical protein VIV11_29040 [Kofleriaceae bacterium]